MNLGADIKVDHVCGQGAQVLNSERGCVVLCVRVVVSELYGVFIGI